MKKLLAVIILCLGLMVFGLPVSASEPGGSDIRIRVYDTTSERILEPDVPPRVIDGRTMVPVRIVAEALGTEVSWDDATKTVIACRGITVVRIPINSMTASCSGEEIGLDVPAQIVEGRTLVPLRFISEAFGATVEWDGGSRTVSVTRNTKPGYKLQLVHRGTDLVGAFCLPGDWVEVKDASGTMCVKQNQASGEEDVIRVDAFISPYTPEEVVSRPEIMDKVRENYKILMPKSIIHSSKLVEHYKDIAMYEHRITNYDGNTEIKLISHSIYIGDTLYVTQVLSNGDLDRHVPVYREMLKTLLPKLGGR
ncbi:MAG: copper amine oxidase N-terminal domain-containing protein [Firmicutes bacterium]|nr:copper amine oxidase N-terminal domain-containing protein [Bacillota bacterium]